MAIRAGAAPRSRWWIVAAGVVAGLVAMVLQLQRGDSLVRAFGEGLGVDFGVMIVCAVSVRLGRGDTRPMRRSKIVAPERKEPMGRKDTSGSSGKTPAQERHEKFVKENGEWNRKVEESVSKLEKSVRGQNPQKA